MNIARSSITIFAAKLLLSSCTFATFLVIARILGPKGLGIYSLFLAVIGLAVNLGNFGLGSASLYLLNKEKRDISTLFSNVLLFGVVWGIVIAGFLTSLSLLFPYIFSLPTIYLVLGFVIIPLHLLIMYLLPFFTAFFEVVWWSFFSITYPVFVFLSTIVAMFFFGLGVTGAVLGVASGSIVTFFLLFIVLWKRYNLHFSPSFAILKEQLRFGLRSYLGELFNTIHFKMNTFMASFFVRIVPIGYLSVGLQLVSVLFFIPFSFQQVFNPLWSSKTAQEVNQNTPKVARQALIVGILGTLILSAFSRQAIMFLFGESFLPAASTFLLLLPGFLASTFTGTLFTNFFAQGRPQITSMILLGTLLFNIILNFFLIPSLGIDGVAISISISLILSSILAILLFSRISHISLSDIIAFKKDDIRSLVRQVVSLK